MKDKDKVFVGIPVWNSYPQSACTIKGVLGVYDRKNIVLCVLDNGSKDPRMQEWVHQNAKEFDIFIQNPFNTGPTIKDNTLIRAFNGTPCEFYVYLENDAIPCSPYPGWTLKHIHKRLQEERGDAWPRVIGFEMARRPTYPLELVLGGMPTLDNHLADLEKRKIDQLFISSKVSRSRPLFMSIAIHREAWDRLGYFDESSVHGDVEFYGRYAATGWDLGISHSLQFMANDFQYNQKRYMDKGRWLGIKIMQMRKKLHSLSADQIMHGNVFRSSMFDPKSFEKYNPVLLDGLTYKEWGEKNLAWYEENVQPDFDWNYPSWLEKDHYAYPEFKPILIGKLQFIGDNKTAEAVEKGEL